MAVADFFGRGKRLEGKRLTGRGLRVVSAALTDFGIGGGGNGQFFNGWTDAAADRFRLRLTSEILRFGQDDTALGSRDESIAC
jgi:hypothetical protein